MRRCGSGKSKVGKNSCVLRGEQGWSGERLENARGLAFLLESRVSVSLLPVDRSHNLEKGRMIGPDHHSWDQPDYCYDNQWGEHGEISLVLR